ncbi:MAG: hypothetical protein ACP5FT_02630 [Acidilobus sp.]
MSCECRGLDGLGLAICLAPPPGDYEVTADVGLGRTLVVNSEGAFLRASSRDDFLPFIRTQEVRVSEETIAALRVDVRGLVCEVIRALRDAAYHGSVVALEKLKRCQELVNEIEEGCVQGRKRL